MPTDRPRAGLPAWLRPAARPGWLWLGGTLVVVGAIVVALFAFSAFAGGRRAAAEQAAAARLSASQLDALDSEAVVAADVTPLAAGQAAARERQLRVDLSALGPAAVRVEPVAAGYVAVVRQEFAFIEAHRLAAARALAMTRVEPASDALLARLRALAGGRARAADGARAVALTGQAVTVLVGFALVAALLFRFAAVRRALAAAQLRQRMLTETSRAKSELIAVVSHDLRTPLTSIVGYLELLRDETAGPVTPEQRRFLAIIGRNADRLLTIVSDLLFVSRVEEGRMDLARDELSLAQIAADAVEEQEAPARARGVSLRLRAEPAPTVTGDRARLDELIGNLLSNAIKFTPAGGRVLIAVGPCAGGARLEVADTGIGIPAGDQDHIFERFFRSPAVIGQPGTGLGLAIVKAIADAHGAALSVTSEPDHGAVFQVDFPAAPAAERGSADRVLPAGGVGEQGDVQRGA